MVLYTVVSCSCSLFSTPRQLHFRPRAGPRPAPAGARECVFPTWVRTPAHARTRARPRARARARSPNSVFGSEGEGGVLYPPLSQTLSKENSIPTYQRYVGMLKRKYHYMFFLHPCPYIALYNAHCTIPLQRAL